MTSESESDFKDDESQPEFVDSGDESDDFVPVAKVINRYFTL
jgi:hypothetical protein